MHTGWQFLGVFMYIHAMSYAKMFHGYDKMKHCLIGLLVSPKMFNCQKCD